MNEPIVQDYLSTETSRLEDPGSPAPVSQNLPLREAARRMLEENAQAFRVTDERQTIVGVITRDGMLRALVDLLAASASASTDPLTKTAYSPVVGEILREAQAAGL